MDGSPIHLACDRWTTTLVRHFSTTIHNYFDDLYTDAITVSAAQGKGKIQSFVDGVFQKWCKAVEKDWTMREAELQNQALRAKYPDLETLVSNVLHSNLMVMSIYRRGSVKEINIPKEGVEKFIHRCYWNVARDVGFPYPIYFNNAIKSAERSLYHNKARKLIDKVLMETIIETIQPTLDKMNEKEKKKRRSRKRSPGRKTKEVDIGELTEENLKKFAEENNMDAVQALEKYKTLREKERIRQCSRQSRAEITESQEEEQEIDDVYPDESASAVYLRQKSDQTDITPAKSVGSSKSKQNSVNFIPTKPDASNQYKNGSLRPKSRTSDVPVPSNKQNVPATPPVAPSIPETLPTPEFKPPSKPASKRSSVVAAEIPNSNVQKPETGSLRGSVTGSLRGSLVGKREEIKPYNAANATPVTVNSSQNVAKITTPLQNPPKLATPVQTVDTLVAVNTVHASNTTTVPDSLNPVETTQNTAQNTIVLPISEPKSAQKSGMSIVLVPDQTPENKVERSFLSETIDGAEFTDDFYDDDFDDDDLYYEDEETDQPTLPTSNTETKPTLPSLPQAPKPTLPNMPVQAPKPSLPISKVNAVPLTPPKLNSKPVSDKFFQTSSDFF